MKLAFGCDPNAQELKTVLEAGCDYIQGFYFHRPMEIPDFFNLLEGTAKEHE